jgi:hypothetical protein
MGQLGSLINLMNQFQINIFRDQTRSQLVSYC